MYTRYCAFVRAGDFLYLPPFPNFRLFPISCCLKQCVFKFQRERFALTFERKRSDFADFNYLHIGIFAHFGFKLRKIIVWSRYCVYYRRCSYNWVICVRDDYCSNYSYYVRDHISPLLLPMFNDLLKIAVNNYRSDKYLPI